MASVRRAADIAATEKAVAAKAQAMSGVAADTSYNAVEIFASCPASP